ncbi:DUF1772 domain-containing protein [Streptomyces armeniacus]|uniref:DUF1772 domain-containing protein n=1 Tax=Streptomyces armeniacus TaxID=83291 RepID=A0A345XLM9_9ACTN|nr:anthrone oxygenase family protein [Streptomyces armeniacus]AXK32545.1 DUF1772 domain-containing protein [Streptomyces armeniacus]
MIPVLAPLALAANGLAAGVLLWAVLGGMPMLRWLPAEQYVRVEQFWGNRFEPFQPVCVALTLLCGAALAAAASGAVSRTLFALAAALAAGVLAVSVTRNVPLKRWVMGLDPDRLPDDWEQRDPRAAWSYWNTVRSVLAVSGFALNALAVGVELSG